MIKTHNTAALSHSCSWQFSISMNHGVSVLVPMPAYPMLASENIACLNLHLAKIKWTISIIKLIGTFRILLWLNVLQTIEWCFCLYLDQNCPRCFIFIYFAYDQSIQFVWSIKEHPFFPFFLPENRWKHYDHYRADAWTDKRKAYI